MMSMRTRMTVEEEALTHGFQTVDTGLITAVNSRLILEVALDMRDLLLAIADQLQTIETVEITAEEGH